MISDLPFLSNVIEKLFFFSPAKQLFNTKQLQSIFQTGFTWSLCLLDLSAVFPTVDLHKFLKKLDRWVGLSRTV